LPAPVDPGQTLGSTSGVPLATCASGGPISPDASGSLTTSLAHRGGQWYFEATIERYEPGWSSIGLFAYPATVGILPALFRGSMGAAAGFKPNGPSTVSVAADLDAGRAYFYVNGALTADPPVLLVPGVGAFRAGAMSMPGNIIRFNFGEKPFAYDVPAGYQPWAAGEADGDGTCVSDADIPAPPAPVTIRCDAGAPCPGTSFQTDTQAATELVVLGVYDSGSVGSWQWGLDANGNPIQVPTGPAQNGSVLVEVNRPGRIALVLSAYEPTDWVVRVGARTELASVAAYGMHQQNVNGLDSSVPLDIHVICRGGDGGRCVDRTNETFPIAPYQWPFSTGGGDTQGFVDYIESRLCLPLKMFAGRYEARHFEID
jgi:hypothetical protein